MHLPPLKQQAELSGLAPDQVVNALLQQMVGKNYYRAFEIRSDSIRMVRGLRVDQREIDAATARKDNDRIAGFDNSMGYISYDPASAGTLDRKQKSVPATYEIDWTADNAPCLSPAATMR